MTSGVYTIFNIDTTQCYVGCSTCIEERWERHCHQLEDHVHPNHLLQTAYNEHPDKFAFIILEFTHPDMTYEREQVWIDRMLRRHELYNLDLRKPTKQ